MEEAALKRAAEIEAAARKRAAEVEEVARKLRAEQEAVRKRAADDEAACRQAEEEGAACKWAAVEEAAKRTVHWGRVSLFRRLGCARRFVAPFSLQGVAASEAESEPPQLDSVFWLLCLRTPWLTREYVCSLLSQTARDGWTPLHAASHAGHVEPRTVDVTVLRFALVHFLKAEGSKLKLARGLFALECQWTRRGYVDYS